MVATDDKDLDDVRAEEGSRGRKRPKTAISRERERAIRTIKERLEDPTCDRDRFLRTLRELGLHDESDEFQKLVALWQQRGAGR